MICDVYVVVMRSTVLSSSVQHNVIPYPFVLPSLVSSQSSQPQKLSVKKLYIYNNMTQVSLLKVEAFYK